MKTVNDMISHWVNETPDAPALQGYQQNALSYAALGEIISETRVMLARNGLGRNDRIAVVHSGGAEMAAALVAIACCATVVPLSPSLTTAEFFLHLHDKKVTAIALEAGLDSPIRAAASKQNIPIIDIVCCDKECAGNIRLEGSIIGAIDREIEKVGIQDDIVVFTTSGTTGYGKIVPLSQQEFVTDLASMVKSLEITSNDMALNIMPLFHTGGFSAGLMACLYSGASFLPVKNNDLDLLFQCLKEQKTTFIMGGYTIFHSLERKAVQYKALIDSAKPRIRMLRTGTGHLDQKIADRLEEIFEAPVVEVYGSSETSFMSCTGIPPMRRKPGSVGRPNLKRIAILNKNAEAVSEGEKGEIAVRKETVFRGYENDDSANQVIFKDNWYLTGDEGLIDADGFLFVTGRLKDMINRGGLKITPTEVDQAMMRHPAIQEAVSYPLPHQTLGEDIGAVIVTKDKSELTSTDMQNFLKEYLAPFKIPRRILFVDEIPKSATGKIQRKKLHSQLTHEENQGPVCKTESGEACAPSETELILKELWQAVLGVDDIGLTDNFFALGGDSLQAVELFLMIEKSLNQRLPRDILFEAGTIADMSRFIANNSTASCIIPIKPDGNRPPFFCIHPIGGEVLGYRVLAKHLEQEQPFYGVRQTGTNNEPLKLSSVEEMADHYLSEIKKTQPTGPYYLGGHSFGGLIAYVIAQKLYKENEKTALLALFDTYVPNSKKNASFLLWLKRHQLILSTLAAIDKPGYIFQRIINIAGRGLSLIKYNLLSLAKSRFRHSNISAGRLFNNQNINTLNARKFTPTPYGGNAVLFATELPISFNDAVHENWKKLVKGKLDVRKISGGHVGIMQEPNVKLLARELTVCLEEHNMTGPTVPLTSLGK